jgi:serine O-acetyltransferase
MIQSKKDYLFYLEADRIALERKTQKPRILGDDIWKFERLLRKLEYYKNCKRGLLAQIYCSYLRFRFLRMSVKLNYSIPPNVFGPGLSIAHRGPIVINREVRVGENCRIHHCVTIGTQPSSEELVPKIGNNVFIGPGAVIVGQIEIADGVAIGANSYVDKSFTEPDITIAGVPARKVSNKSARHRFIQATEIVRSALIQRSKT